MFVVDYDMKQAEILMLSKAEKFNAENMPLIKLHNEYFGGSMGSIVFQTLRSLKHWPIRSIAPTPHLEK